MSQQGNQGNSTITTTISGGFNSAISLSASGMPSGTTVSFNPEHDSGARLGQLDHDHHGRQQHADGNLSHHGDGQRRRHPAERDGQPDGDIFGRRWWRKRDHRVLDLWIATDESLCFDRTVLQARRHSSLRPGGGRRDSDIDAMRRKEPLGRRLAEIWDHQFHRAERGNGRNSGHLPETRARATTRATWRRPIC